MTDRVTRIVKDDDVATQINTITVEPENQRELLKSMKAQAIEVMARMPGFVSVNLHRSLDGTRVTNYAQWQSERGLKEAHEDPDFVSHIEGYKDLVIKGGPRIYTIVRTVSGNTEGPITIREDGDGVTLIKVLETAPEHQPDLAELYLGGLYDITSKKPGFRTATLLRSHDHTQVVSYEQWKDLEAYEAATNSDEPAYASHMERVGEIATPDPHLYEVAFTIDTDE